MRSTSRGLASLIFLFVFLFLFVAARPLHAQAPAHGPLSRLLDHLRQRPSVMVQTQVQMQTQAAAAAPANCDCNGADPYGFAAILNRLRAAAGLHPLAYDPELSSWASQNNAAQCRRGIGHHINPCGVQNCGWNYADASSVAQGWMDSPGHRRNMLSPSVSRFGIAFGPGPYWTLNAR